MYSSHFSNHFKTSVVICDRRTFLTLATLSLLVLNVLTNELMNVKCL